MTTTNPTKAGDNVRDAALSQGTPERLEAVSLQLYGLTALMFGEAGEVFRGHSEAVQEGVQWLTHDLVCEMRNLVGDLLTERLKDANSGHTPT